MVSEERDGEVILAEASAGRAGGRWQLWIGAFVILGGLFTIGWAVVETWWG